MILSNTSQFTFSGVTMYQWPDLPPEIGIPAESGDLGLGLSSNSQHRESRFNNSDSGEAFSQTQRSHFHNSVSGGAYSQTQGSPFNHSNSGGAYSQTQGSLFNHSNSGGAYLETQGSPFNHSNSDGAYSRTQGSLFNNNYCANAQAARHNRRSPMYPDYSVDDGDSMSRLASCTPVPNWDDISLQPSSANLLSDPAASYQHRFVSIKRPCSELPTPLREYLTSSYSVQLRECPRSKYSYIHSTLS